jgi:hypothetical protein
MAALPPDLDRLGDALTAAAQRKVSAAARRSARARLAIVGIAGALAAAVLVPGPLGPATRLTPDIQIAAAPVMVDQTTVCGQPRGARFSAPRSCEMLHPAPQALR